MQSSPSTPRELYLAMTFYYCNNFSLLCQAPREIFLFNLFSSQFRKAAIRVKETFNQSKGKLRRCQGKAATSIQRILHRISHILSTCCFFQKTIHLVIFFNSTSLITLYLCFILDTKQVKNKSK